MSSAITALGQTRINELRGEEKPLVIDRMVLALVPGLDPSQPVDRNQQMPDPAHVVHTHTIDDAHKGYVNPDQVVYSMILGSDVGDFSFNWIGTVEAVTGNVITVTTTPETPKRKTDLGSNTTGNNITRNVMMRFEDAQALTGVSVSAETWQFDYTTWMVARIGEHDGDGGAHSDIRNEFAAKYNAAIARGYQPGDEMMLPYVPNVSEMNARRMLERNGSTLLRADYPELFAKIGTMYGAVDSLHFNLPDDRGLFSRMWDNGAGIDPDSASRTARGDGTTGDNVGTLQASDNKSHSHMVDTRGAINSGGGNSSNWPIGANHNRDINPADDGYVTYTGGAESRPKNVYKWGGIFY